MGVMIGIFWPEVYEPFTMMEIAMLVNPGFTYYPGFPEFSSRHQRECMYSWRTLIG